MLQDDKTCLIVNNDTKRGSLRSPFTIHRSLRPAFTLAEVLITLGIIAVVAAMTIPVLYNNYQKQATVAKVQKFYSEMNQALNLSKADNGDFSTWTFASTDELYDNYLANYMHATVTKRNVQLWGDFVGGLTIVLDDGTQMLLSKTSNFVGGTTICIFQTKVNNWTLTSSINLLNPIKETFYFTIDTNGRLIPPHLTASRATNLDNCKNFSWGGTSNGHIDCSTVIVKDGWTIQNDYPW